MRRAGFSLVEITLVVLILGLLATAFVQAPAAGKAEATLAVAAERTASALRFARTEAIRTGQPHGTRFMAAEDRMRVYSLDLTTAPPSEDFNVLHPLSKHAYDDTLGTDFPTHGCELVEAKFLYDGDGTVRGTVAFDEDGRPVSPITLQALQNGSVKLRCRERSRLVQLQPEIGRVTVP